MVSISEYAYSFKDFCLSTTIHGFHYIASTKGISKVFWWLVWLTMFMFMLWSCAKNIIEYRKFEVKTDIMYEYEHEIEFPTITFCSQFGISKSKIGSHNFALLAYIATLTHHTEDVAKRFRESERLCNITLTLQAYLNKEEEMKKLADEGILSVTKRIGWNALNAVKKCWWNNVEVECRGLFANTFSDNGVCFMFLPFQPSDAVFRSLLKLDNTLNKSLLVDRKITFGGPKNGLRILMDVGQEDKCDTVKKYEGNGFTVAVHDQLSFVQISDINSFLTLTPGYEIDVILKPTVFSKNTAHLGYCRLPVYIFLNRPVYFRSLCIYVCIIKLIMRNCNCYMKATSAFDEADIGNVLGININKFANCKDEQLNCVKDQQMRVLSLNNMDVLCPHCIQPCFETKYNALLTYKKISLDVGKYFEKNVSLLQNVSKIRKSYLMANFYFDSMTVLHVTESQKITFVDVLMHFGGAICLFLGASYMSLNEIVQLLIHPVIKRLAKNCKFHERQIKVLPKLNPNQMKTPGQFENKTRKVNTNTKRQIKVVPKLGPNQTKTPRQFENKARKMNTNTKRQIKVLPKVSPNETQISLQPVSSNETLSIADDENEKRTTNANLTCSIDKVACESMVVPNTIEYVESIQNISKDTDNKGDVFVADLT